MMRLLDPKVLGRLLMISHEYGIDKDLLMLFGQVNIMIGKEAQRKSVPAGTMTTLAEEIIFEARASAAQEMFAEQNGEGP
jgi:hypothetical protein